MLCRVDIAHYMKEPHWMSTCMREHVRVIRHGEIILPPHLSRNPMDSIIKSCCKTTHIQSCRWTRPFSKRKHSWSKLPHLKKPAAAHRSWGSSCYCAFGPTFVAMWVVCKPAMKLGNPCRQACSFCSCWKWGNCGDTSHSRASTLWVWLYTLWNKRVCNFWDSSIEWLNVAKKLAEIKMWERDFEGHLSYDTLVSSRGGRREQTSGWEKKTKPPESRKQVTTSKGWKLTWALVLRQCVSLVQLCHLTSWRKGTWIHFHTTWQLFLKTQKLFSASSK